MSQAPRLNVKLLANLLDFKVTPVVTATLHYDDQQGNLHKVDTFPFTAVADTAWSFPIAADSGRKYRAQVTYNTADGQSIKQAEQTTDETVLVLPKLLVPEIAVEVNAKVVNFVETPLVEVDVNYEDRTHNIVYEETLVFSGPDPQKFRVQVDKDSPREYFITVTYYLSDGKVVVRPGVSLDKSKIVVPRYVAGA